MSEPKVFISYSHDSAEHRDQVLVLANRLRKDGVDAQIDQFVNGTPPEKWPRWMLNCIESATHVLCVCTPTYYRRFRGKELPRVGKGADWEGAVITQEIYDSRSYGTKFIPVMFANGKEADIPEPLRGSTHYRLEAGYEDLYDAILGQAGIEPAPIGQKRVKPRRTASSAQSVPTLQPARDNQTQPEPTEEELATVFTDTVLAIESALDSAPSLAKLVGPNAPVAERLTALKGNQWTVQARYRSGGEDVGPVLKGIWNRRNSFAAPRHEWDALEHVIGGILVLGINPRWVWEQRRVAPIGAIFHPKFAEQVDTESGGKAQFLAAISASLANGCSRLDRVFGHLDPKRIPDIPPINPGTTSADRAAEIKRHFIRFILGPSDEWDVDKMEGDTLDTFFKRVRQKLLLARKVDQDPFFAAGLNLSRLMGEVKTHLELSDLYLFVPALTGDESDLMTDPVIALTLAQRLHKFILEKRPNI